MQCEVTRASAEGLPNRSAQGEARPPKSRQSPKTVYGQLGEPLRSLMVNSGRWIWAEVGSSFLVYRFRSDGACPNIRACEAANL